MVLFGSGGRSHLSVVMGDVAIWPYVIVFHGISLPVPRLGLAQVTVGTCQGIYF